MGTMGWELWDVSCGVGAGSVVNCVLDAVGWERALWAGSCGLDAVGWDRGLWVGSGGGSCGIWERGWEVWAGCWMGWAVRERGIGAGADGWSWCGWMEGWGWWGEAGLRGLRALCVCGDGILLGFLFHLGILA